MKLIYKVYYSPSRDSYFVTVKINNRVHSEVIALDPNDSHRANDYHYIGRF